jgi:hypothetical protein
MVGVGAAMALWAAGRREPPQRPPAPSTARATVVEYLQALEKRERGAILKLVPADYEATRMVDERLQLFGGVRTEGADIRITSDISPEVLSVNIRSTGPEGRELVWTENLFWREGAWRLVLGGRGDGRAPADIQRPAP